MHGTADWRVPPEESLHIAVEFQKLKIPYRLIMMEGEDHGLTTKQEEVNQIVKSWFHRFLVKGESLPNLELHGN